MIYSSNVAVKENRVTVTIEGSSLPMSIDLAYKFMELSTRYDATDYGFSYENDLIFSAKCDSLEDLNDLSSELAELIDMV